jgi:hypothetical protein
MLNQDKEPPKSLIEAVTRLKILEDRLKSLNEKLRKGREELVKQHQQEESEKLYEQEFGARSLEEVKERAKKKQTESKNP